jgi:uncharacterized cupredoxin-like copper-binding protein
MEFSGRGDDCFGRVKAVIENKIVINPSTRAGRSHAAAANCCSDVTCTRSNLAARAIRPVASVNDYGRLSAPSQFMFAAGQRASNSLRAPSRDYHSGLMPANFATLPHFSISATT